MYFLIYGLGAVAFVLYCQLVVTEEQVNRDMEVIEDWKRRGKIRQYYLIWVSVSLFFIATWPLALALRFIGFLITWKNGEKDE